MAVDASDAAARGDAANEASGGTFANEASGGTFVCLHDWCWQVTPLTLSFFAICSCLHTVPYVDKLAAN